MAIDVWVPKEVDVRTARRRPAVPTDYEDQARALLHGLEEEFDIDYLRLVQYGQPAKIPHIPEVTPEELERGDRFDSVTAINQFYRHVHDTGEHDGAVSMRDAFDTIDNARAFLDELGAAQSWQMLAQVPQQDWQLGRGPNETFDGVRALFGVTTLDKRLRDDVESQRDLYGTVVDLARYGDQQFLIVETTQRNEDGDLQRGLWAARLDLMEEILDSFSFREIEHARQVLKDSQATSREIDTVLTYANRRDTVIEGDAAIERRLYEARVEARSKPRHSEARARGIKKVGRFVREAVRMVAGVTKGKGAHRAQSQEDSFLMQRAIESRRAAGQF